MKISSEYRTITIISLSEFKSLQVERLLDFAARYRDSSNPQTLLQCIFNCVHLYEKAEKALNEIGDKANV